jgi:hypothetical protein
VLGPASQPAAADAAVDASVELPPGVLAGLVPDDLVPTLQRAYWDLPSGYDDDCHLDYPETEPPACVYGPADATVPVLLLGDSHAQQWLPALQRLADERGWRLRAITKSGCPLIDATVWNGPLKRGYRECDAWRERVLQLIDEERPALVLVASADMYDIVDAEGHLLKDGEGGAAAETAAWDAALASYLARMAERAPRLVVLADTPRVGYDPAECLATKPGIEDCDAERERMVDEGYAAREAAAAASAGVPVIAATEWLCPGQTCPLVRGPFLVYRDAHHLTATFAAQLASKLGTAIDAATGDELARD